MATNPTQQHMSFEQYLQLVSHSDRRYEYYDGEVRLMAGGSSNHATIALNQYGAGQNFQLASLDTAIEVRQLYRRLSILALVEQLEEEGEE